MVAIPNLFHVEHWLFQPEIGDAVAPLRVLGLRWSAIAACRRSIARLTSICCLVGSRLSPVPIAMSSIGRNLPTLCGFFLATHRNWQKPLPGGFTFRAAARRVSALAPVISDPSTSGSSCPDPAEATMLPSRLKHTARTPPWCSFKAARPLPMCTSHKRNTLSSSVTGQE